MNCLIVDDEKLALDLMEDNISQVSYLSLAGRCKNASEAIQFLSKNTVDLIFLDIQMPGISGIQFLSSLKNPPMIIMVTAYEKYALEGFNLDVVDYLVKPVPFDRFLKAANKAYELHNLRQQASAPESAQNSSDYLFVNADYSLVKIVIDDITYIEGLKDYIKIHLQNTDKPVITRLSMHFMEEKLPAARFKRVHRSYIISLDKITAYKRPSVIIGKEEIPVSDNYRDELMNYIEKK